MSTDQDPLRLWHYVPSMPAAIIACIIFSAITMYHIWLLVKSRMWYCIPFVVGGLFEIIGYAARAAGHNDLTGLGAYIIQSLLLLLAPPLFAASIYMILGRIIRATHAESLSLVRVTRITKIFVISDVLCFFVQSGGGGIQATGDGKNSQLGQNIILAGLILQIVIFLFFLVVAGVFHKRLRQRPTPQSMDTVALPWERLMHVLYLVSVLITVRNFFRVIEYGMGKDGYLLTHEWTLYVFDGLLMAITLAICVIWYQHDLRPRPTSLESCAMEEHGCEQKPKAFGRV